MPGYTHSKQAEPVTFGHWCLAYVEMLQRDLVAHSPTHVERGDECPLGSGALAGTPLNRSIARSSRTPSASRARPPIRSTRVSDRDFAAEYLFCASTAAARTSRAWPRT